MSPYTIFLSSLRAGDTVTISNRHGDTLQKQFKRFENGCVVVEADPAARFRRNELSFNHAAVKLSPGGGVK